MSVTSICIPRLLKSLRPFKKWETARDKYIHNKITEGKVRLDNESLSLINHMLNNLETTPTEQDRGIVLTTRLDGSKIYRWKLSKHCHVFVLFSFLSLHLFSFFFVVFLLICNSAYPTLAVEVNRSVAGCHIFLAAIYLWTFRKKPLQIFQEKGVNLERVNV